MIDVRASGPTGDSRRTSVSTPERMQLAPTESGAAALAILLGHYGRWVSLEEARDACGVSRDGSTPESVAIAARSYGLQPTITATEPQDLLSMSMPVVIHWRFKHYIVLEGWSKKGWLLNDPAVGHRVCPADEFDEAFTGTVITATPGPQFERGGRPPRTLHRLGAHLVGSRDGIALMALIGVILIVPAILVPGLARAFVDAFVGNSAASMSTILGALVLAAILQAVLVGLQGSIGVRLANKVSVLLSAAMMDRLLRIPMQFYDLRGPSTLNQRAAQPNIVATTVASLFSTLVIAVLSSATAALVLLFTYWPAGIVALVSLVAIVIMRRSARARRKTLAERTVRGQTDISVITATALAQIEVIKASGAEDAIVAKWAQAHDRMLTASQELGEKTSMTLYLPRVVTTVAGIAVTITALYGVSVGALSLGGLVAVQTLNGLVLGSIPSAVTQLEQAENLTGQLDQIEDVLGTRPDPRLVQWSVSQPDDLTPVTGELSLRGVSFGYNKNAPPLITDLDLHLTPGKRIALVGPSGCGKSTVSRLVVGWYEPWSGEVRVDGKLRDEWPESTLTSYIAMVEQDPKIFSGTINDNISMWNPTIPEIDIIQAAKDACLHDDIIKRVGAYESVLAEQGEDLSGGQRQRLEIARSLARNPSLLVLDEATSALDAATEAAVDAAIRRRGAAVLVIAHRLSTIRDCDEIIVLDKGEVVERGTHDELIANHGPYADLVRS
ncbi:MAG: ATP-binding cassette domain-containing protein [Candidatus Nanopelagicales bacterium]|nr:ATP-binding cassette domain-containing protein [Candidatus Nanopelagicales bacterium]MDZ4249612.1 ATP-binding cassette domain-containing protein [Candidatus Nanopelagicales bacterium]MDZ7577184.1 ATP-binding cassette domain-containing protein [Candidatus Nanopelagicales bacterium]